MLPSGVYPTECRINRRRGAGRASLQTFGLASPHRLQLRILNLVLLEHIVGLHLGVPPYLPRTELRLIVKLSAFVRPSTS